MKGCRWMLAHTRTDTIVTSIWVLCFPHYKWFKQIKQGIDKKAQVTECSRPYWKFCTGAVQKCFCHCPPVLTSQAKNNEWEESCGVYCNFSAVSHTHPHFKIIVSNHKRWARCWSDRIWISLSIGHPFAGNALHMPIECKEKIKQNTFAFQFLFSGHKSNHHPENEHFLGFNNCWVNSSRQRQLHPAHNFTHRKCVTLHLSVMSLQDTVNRINLNKQFLFGSAHKPLWKLMLPHRFAPGSHIGLPL